MLNQQSGPLKRNEAKTDYYFKLNKEMIKFATEIEETRKICIKNTQSLLQKRSSPELYESDFDEEDVVRSDLKDRLGLISSRFLGKVVESMSQLCSDGNIGKFQLDFTEGGAMVKLIGQDISHLGKTVTDVQ